MYGMTREEARDRLMQLAEAGEEETVRVSCEDSNREGQMQLVWDAQSGDLCLSVLPGGMTFAGVGGGDHRPLIKEALRLLALAVREETSHARKM